MESGSSVPHAGAIVLAGGKSSRMGQSKALLLFDGVPLIEHVVRTLQELFGEIVVVAAPGQDLPALPVTLVHDEVAFQGPVGGLCYGLRATTRDVSFVTSCDSVFLNKRLITHLVSQIRDHDVVVPHWEGRLQPLHAVYRRSVLPLLEDQLVRGELRPVSLFDRVRTRRVDEDEIRRFDPQGASFFNMNTPADYAAARARWEGAKPIECVVELFGVARLVSNTGEVPLSVPAAATVSHVLAALAEKLPVLVGRVISADRRTLVQGYVCNINGVEFISTPGATINQGDRIVILSADAGG